MQINFIFQLRPPPLYTKAESETHSCTKREITFNTSLFYITNVNVSALTNSHSSNFYIT